MASSSWYSNMQFAPALRDPQLQAIGVKLQDQGLFLHDR